MSFNYLKERINTLSGVSTRNFGDIYIETTANCTNDCFMCPRQGIKHYGTMKKDTFELVIQKLKDINYKGQIHLYGQGEPFLDKDIIKKIYYVKENLPDNNIILISNFTVLNDSLIDEIVKAPIHNLSCSVYALTEESYKKICKRNNFKLAFINQVKFMKKYAQQVPFSFAFYIVNNDYIAQDFDFMKYYFSQIVPCSLFQISSLLSLFNSKHAQLKKSKKYFSPCIYNDMKISSDGVISSCPCDAENKLEIGHIFHDKESLKEIYNNEKAREFRKKMLYSNEADSYCQFCAFRRGSTLFEYMLPIFKKKSVIFDPYGHKLEKSVYSKEQIQNKLKIFNDIFKDDEEDNWINSLKILRENFYETERTSHEIL